MKSFEPNHGMENLIEKISIPIKKILDDKKNKKGLIIFLDSI
jgi:hypothetical protein